MRRMPWAVYLWPGLPQISQQGSWAALVVALVAALLLNVALIGSFAWPELIGHDLRIICWAGVAIVWAGCAGVSIWHDRRQANRPHDDSNSDPLGEAINCYLRGDWFETERVLNRLLRRNQRDLEARLMLATLLRHTKRLDEATRQLNVLVRLEGAQKWELEIRREGQLITDARTRTITSANTAQGNNGED
jgi:hypothetical protein